MREKEREIKERWANSYGMRLGEEGVQMEERKSTIGISESEMRETSNGMQATAGRTVQIKRHAKSAKFAASLASRAGRKDRRNSPSSSRRFLEVDDDEYVDACIECNRSGYTQIFNCRTVLELCVVVLFTVYHLHSLTMCEVTRLIPPTSPCPLSTLSSHLFASRAWMNIRG